MGCMFKAPVMCCPKCNPEISGAEKNMRGLAKHSNLCPVCGQIVFQCQITSCKGKGTKLDKQGNDEL